MSIQFNVINDISELYKRAEQVSQSNAKVTDKIDGSFKISIGIVNWHSQDHQQYKVLIINENKIANNVILFFDPFFYAINGYPVIGEKVKVLHQTSLNNAYLLGRVNTLSNQIVLDNNCSIAKGINMP